MGSFLSILGYPILGLIAIVGYVVEAVGAIIVFGSVVLLLIGTVILAGAQEYLVCPWKNNYGTACPVGPTTQTSYESAMTQLESTFNDKGQDAITGFFCIAMASVVFMVYKRYNINVYESIPLVRELRQTSRDSMNI
jgi:hypothetical protein